MTKKDADQRVNEIVRAFTLPNMKDYGLNYTSIDDDSSEKDRDQFDSYIARQEGKSRSGKKFLKRLNDRFGNTAHGCLVWQERKGKTGPYKYSVAAMVDCTNDALPHLPTTIETTPKFKHMGEQARLLLQGQQIARNVAQEQDIEALTLIQPLKKIENQGGFGLFRGRTENLDEVLAAQNDIGFKTDHIPPEQQRVISDLMGDMPYVPLTMSAKKARERLDNYLAQLNRWADAREREGMDLNIIERILRAPWSVQLTMDPATGMLIFTARKDAEPS